MKGRNPLLPPKIHVPDGEAHVMNDGRVYLYGSLDKSTDGYCSKEYIVASSSDMKEWMIHEGPSFTVAEATWGKTDDSGYHSSMSQVKKYDDLPEHIRKRMPPICRIIPVRWIVSAIESRARKDVPKELRLYAPDAAEKNGKYYLYFCMSDDSEGVAVSDHPEGPFKDPVRIPIRGIDPSVFVDQDGQAYYYWGQFEANAVQLHENMTEIDETSIVKGIVTEKLHHFHEGSSVRRRGDIYYYVFADISRGKPTCLGYATGPSPMGPFTYQGVIIDNVLCDPKSWNNHGCIEEINGQWYVFYHRSSGNRQYLRRACAEPIFFDGDGRIAEVKMTSQGAGEPFTIGEMIPAYTACEVIHGAYVDEEILVMPKEGKAIFRYFKNEFPVSKVLVEGETIGQIVVRVDDDIVLEAASASSEVTIPPGIHEVTLENRSGKTIRLSGFRML